jgi:hypothetical protein
LKPSIFSRLETYHLPRLARLIAAALPGVSGLPPSLPLSRAAFVFLADLTKPPSLPNSTAAGFFIFMPFVVCCFYPFNFFTS